MPTGAIETYYKGYRFRSRTEARYAVFLDMLGIRYKYEVEGFDLGEAGRYLPDFWLPDYHYWLEIKGECPTPQEQHKAWALYRVTARPALISYDYPGDHPLMSAYSPHWDTEAGDPFLSANWYRCPTCGQYDVTIIHGTVIQGVTVGVCHCKQYPGDEDAQRFHPDIVDAFLSARAARFEWGETPR